MGVAERRLGKFVLERTLGTGGMAHVYQAVNSETADRVALKALVPPPRVSQVRIAEFVERFRREAMATAALSHPNIVKVFEVGAVNDRYYIAMEQLSGQTLRNELEVSGALPIPRALDILEQVVSALGAVHTMGIIHRDIKPDNIFITPGDVVKLTDFGVARLQQEAAITTTGEVIGSPNYMSPEQARGLSVDHRSDIFSLGAVFYEMLVGRKCFPGQAVGEVVSHILRDEPPPLEGPLAEFRPALAKALAKDPEMRYESVGQFLAAVREAAAAVQTGATLVTSPSATVKTRVVSQPAAVATRLSLTRPVAVWTEELSGWLIFIIGLIMAWVSMLTWLPWFAGLAALCGLLAVAFRAPWRGAVLFCLAALIGLGEFLLR